MKWLLSLVLVLVATLAMSLDGKAGPYRFQVRTEPQVIPVGKAKLYVRVSDSTGAPVEGATVKVLVKMPNMNMGEREEMAVVGTSVGEYACTAVFSMAGAYDIRVTVDGKEGSGQGSVSVATRQSSVSPSGGVPSWLLPTVLVLGVALVIVWRMRATGQRMSVGGVLNRKALVPLLLLASCLAVAIWAVNNLRRDGAMTPLEAQVMEMNTPAPEGSLPVRLATAKVEEFHETVVYSGQVVGFVEQDVVPRVSGKIIAMPVYVGDRVRRGQLLARLDTSQTDPMVAEAAARVSSASQGVGVAASEMDMAVNMTREAKAEVSMAEAEITESRAMLDAATAGVSTSDAEVESAVAEVKAARAVADSATADWTYQSQELERMKQLYAKGVISKDEWQIAQSDAQKSEAMLREAKGMLQKAEAMHRAAVSRNTKETTEVRAAETRVRRAEANLRAKRAAEQTAESAVRTARAKVGQSRAEVAEKSAGLRGAAAQRAYAELRAETDGVVTERLISPGVVVSPGQPVLKVAQVNPVRIQANVPQEDLSRIRVGARMSVRRPDTNERLDITVSAVAPSVDPASRLGRVEAVVSNSKKEFFPGQFVSLEIAVGETSRLLVVPEEALVESSRGTERVYSVWVASAASGGLTVAPKEVVLFGRANGKVAVRDGLKKGDRVVLSPQGLAAGSKIVVINEPASASDHARVEITEEGFVPNEVSLIANKPTKITFLRKTDGTCATEAIFKSLHITADLPLNKEVTVEIPPQPEGTKLGYACAMDMIKGSVVFR